MRSATFQQLIWLGVCCSAEWTLALKSGDQLRDNLGIEKGGNITQFGTAAFCDFA